MRRAVFRPFTERPRASAVGFWLLAAIVGVVPLFIWPAAQDSFVLPKEALLHALTWLLLASLLTAAASGASLRVIFHPINGFLILFFLWQLLSVLWARSPELAWDQVRETGMLLLLVFAAQSFLVGERQHLLTLTWVLIAASACVSAWVLAVDGMAAFHPESLGIRRVLGDWRDYLSTASLGNTGHIADFVVLGFLAALALFVSTRNLGALVLLFAALLLKSACLIVCWSVHSNASLILGAALFVFLLRGHGKSAHFRRVLRRLVPLGAGFAIIILFYVVDHPLNPHGSHAWGDDPAYVVEGEPSGGIFAQAFSSARWKAGGPTRLAIWLTTLEIVSNNTWLGTGAGNFTYVYPETRPEIVLADAELAPYASLWTNAAHNTFLQTWSETGVLGVYLLVMIAGAVFVIGIRRIGNEGAGNDLVLAGGLSMFAAICVQAQMTFPLELPISAAAFFLVASVPVVLSPRGDSPDLLLPVSRKFAGVRIGVLMKNMRLPVQLMIEPRFGRAGVWCFSAVVWGLAGWLGYQSLDTLRASVLYRPVYEASVRAEGMGIRSVESGWIDESRRALALDPSYVDCRSRLSSLLLRAGRFGEALEEVEKVKRRLNAIEVYEREALCYQALGDGANAMRAWDVVFTRMPAYGARYPEAYRQWLIWESEQSPASTEGSEIAPES